LTVQNTLHAKIETGVPSHVKVIIEPFAFGVYNLETESEVVAKY
jgi:translation elongation factor EF-1beta